MRIKLPANASRRRMIKAVQAEFARLHKELAPQLSQLPDQDTRNINVAQNVMRDCLSALYDAMIPYGHVVAVQMSQRAASYALSVVPIEDQDAVVAAHLDGFADLHQHRTASGIRINTEWSMHDGAIQTNFPEE